MQFVNPAILDMEPATVLAAKLLTPLKKRKAKGPQIVRKKLHWVPIKVREDSSYYSMEGEGAADRAEETALGAYQSKRIVWKRCPSDYVTINVPYSLVGARAASR